MLLQSNNKRKTRIVLSHKSEGSMSSAKINDKQKTKQQIWQQTLMLNEAGIQ